MVSANPQSGSSGDSARPPTAAEPSPSGRLRAVLLRTPPPVIYVAAFLLGIGIERLLPRGAPPSLLADAHRPVGAILLAIGIVLGPANALMFLIRGTTLNPAGSPRRLFTGGLYRFSRNPMYLGLLLVYAGVAVLNWQLWALLLVWLPFLAVDRVYIPREERQMLEIFGAQYEAYRQQVRRWLGRR